MKTRELLRLDAILVFLIIFYSAIGAGQTGESFQSSIYCVECHEDRYKEWSGSMHALAVMDPIYRTAYMKAVLFEPSYREYCLKCHSPTTNITKDFNLTKSLSIEGVSCSFCHSVKEVDIKNNTYELNQNGTMVGPYRDSFTEKHPSNYSDILTKSEFCAGCHEFSLNGIPISETYSEWKEGPYSKEGKQCQDCHMQALPGYVANNIKRENVYRHLWYGGHTGQFLEKAFNVDYQIEKEGKKVKVTVNITNKNVGHKIPSGLPTRQVILHFNVTDDKGKEIYGDKRIYAKTLLDQYGNEINDFWKAKSLDKDNRIKPKETKTEIFEFDLPDGVATLEVHTKLIYHLEAEIIQTSVESMDVELINKKDTINLDNMEIQESTSKKLLPKETSPEQGEQGGVSKKVPGFITGLFILAIIMAIILRKKKDGKKKDGR